jgi:hypothetical protein
MSVAVYRCYLLDAGNHIIGTELFRGTDDEAAICVPKNLRANVGKLPRRRAVAGGPDGLPPRGPREQLGRSSGRITTPTMIRLIGSTTGRTWRPSPSS